MKSAFVMGLILVATLSIREDAAAQGVSQRDRQELAFTMLVEGGGACEDVCPPRGVSALMGGTYVIQDVFIPSISGQWSPAGTKVLTASNDIFVTPVVGGPSVNLTNHPATYGDPAWSPDGTRVAFASDRDGGNDLYIMNADGSDVVRIVAGLGSTWYPTWSPDSQR